jgi:uncharacterized protein YjbI with pentapeptide repeats
MDTKYEVTIVKGVVVQKNSIVEDCDLEYGDLSNLDLHGIKFVDTDLDYADFENTSLEGAMFEDVELGRADLKKTNLKGAYFDKVDLSEADLRGVNFSEVSHLSNCNFDGADLTGANLTGLDLYGCTFKDAILEGVVGVNIRG